MSEVNKEQAEKCRDIGASELRKSNYERAVKMLSKSLRLYKLPGVEALLSHAQSKLDESKPTATTNGTTSSSQTTTPNISRQASTASSNQQQGADGRPYTDEQHRIVKEILSRKNSGRGAHYKILSIERTATESQIKKAYRKLSLKVHPDKNSAPHAAEAFKAVSLAYATLSDEHKRHIYDTYGDEDPDNRSNNNPMRRGQEMSPEDIFNAFFGGHPPGGFGNGGVHFYSTGFGPGMHFRGGGMPRGRQRQQQQQQEQAQQPGFAVLLQLLPVLFFMLISFLSQTNSDGFGTAKYMPGENQYFSLTNKPPFHNELHTKLSKVKDIPYYVSDKFLRTYYRDRYQRSKVEYMVEKAYENFLFRECKSQREYKQRLVKSANEERDREAKQRKLQRAQSFQLGRCDELREFFPDRKLN